MAPEELNQSLLGGCVVVTSASAQHAYELQPATLSKSLCLSVCVCLSLSLSPSLSLFSLPLFLHLFVCLCTCIHVHACRRCTCLRLWKQVHALLPNPGKEMRNQTDREGNRERQRKIERERERDRERERESERENRKRTSQSLQQLTTAQRVELGLGEIEGRCPLGEGGATAP